MTDHRYLLVSDVDDTLLGDDDALHLFSRWVQENRGQLQLAYASGRFVDSVRQSIDGTDLPEPDAVIGGVGSQIVSYPGGRLLDAWQTRIGNHWNAQAVRCLLAAEEDLQLQPEEFQSAYKVSFFLHEATQRRLEDITALLRREGIHADIVYSSQRDLDVMPENVNKGTAARFLAEHWEFPPTQVLVSGNSANDSALFQHGYRGIVVGNAHEELKALGGQNVYVAEQGFAAGVMEGLQHWIGAALTAVAP